jgi:hypothetical protein
MVDVDRSEPHPRTAQMANARRDFDRGMTAKPSPAEDGHPSDSGDGPYGRRPSSPTIG